MQAVWSEPDVADYVQFLSPEPRYDVYADFVLGTVRRLCTAAHFFDLLRLRFLAPVPFFIEGPLFRCVSTWCVRWV